VAVSQSGETADTLGALRAARERGSQVVAICNVVGSSMAREADGVLYTRAEIEIGVASTKAFTAQLAAVTLLALKLARARGLADPNSTDRAVKALWEAPGLMAAMLEGDGEIRALAERFVSARNAL
jgi:glucosamine--fructose-6-phosphate aminotransferase (isomerizing)